MLSGHDFLMARAALDELAEGVRELTVCIDSAKTVLVPAALYSTDMNEGYMANFSEKWYVLFFYVLNLIMVGCDLVLYYRNYLLDKKAAE